MKMQDIDKHLDASGVVKLIELKQRESETRLKNMLNVAGFAKPGIAVGVQVAAHDIAAAILGKYRRIGRRLKMIILIT